MRACQPHHDHQQRADEAGLFRPYREYEIGVRLRQVEQLLHAIAEPDTEPLAAADGYQRLGQLEAAVKRVGPGIEECRQALHAIRRGHGQSGQRHTGHTEHAAEMPEPHTGDEDHAHGRCHQDHGGTEVGLHHQQQRRQYQDGQRDHRDTDRVPD